MRITAGTYRNRTLKTPSSDTIRPASDKVRQAVFNMLVSYDLPRDSYVIDGFCGTGSYGLEAISRGAKNCIFIDQDRTARTLCEANIETLGCADQSTFIGKNMMTLTSPPASLPPANLVFLDPPYGKDLLPRAIVPLLTHDWAAEDALFVIEHGKNEVFSTPYLNIIKEKQYGDVTIKFYMRQI